MRRSATSLCSIALLTGCASQPPLTEPPLPVAPGARLIVQQAMTVPADVTRIYVQHGTAGGARDITVWNHHCALIVPASVAQGPTRILPDTPLVVADIQRIMDAGVWEKGVINYRTRIRFTPASDPIQAMECELWQYGYDPRAWLDPAELISVLGDVIAVESP